MVLFWRGVEWGQPNRSEIRGGVLTDYTLGTWVDEEVEAYVSVIQAAFAEYSETVQVDLAIFRWWRQTLWADARLLC